MEVSYENDANLARKSVRRLGLFFLIALLACAVAIQTDESFAQLVGFQQAVGGISIRPDGLVENATVETLGNVRKARERLLGEPPADLKGRTPLRKISLRKLDAALAAAIRTGKPLANDLNLLGGLQRIRYVFVYPKQKDIVLVGPAEDWKLDADGNIVGKTTGRPPLNLDNLVVASGLR